MVKANRAVKESHIMGSETTHTYTHQYAPNTQKQMLPIDVQCNRNHKNVLHKYTCRRDHTSSTLSKIIRNNRSPKTGKKHIKTPLPTSTTTRGHIRQQITTLNLTTHTRIIFGRTYSQLLTYPNISQLNTHIPPLRYNQTK